MWFPFPRIPPSGCPATKEVYLSPHHTCICISPACEQYTIIIQRSTYKNYASYAMYIVHGYRRHYLRTSLHKVVEAQATGNNNINIRRIYISHVCQKLQWNLYIADSRGCVKGEKIPLIRAASSRGYGGP